MESQASYRTLQPGEMLNWYRIERILGRGGFGVIYLATDTNLDHQVAVKEYIPSNVATRAGDSQVEPITEDHSDMFRWGMDRFIKEARNLVKFKHPNIVRVMSVFQENNTAYMVMEFEEGEDLRSYLRKPGAASEHSLKQLIVPISEGLAEVHRHGFIHRDIKPANILVRKDGTPVLLDFGSARNASKFTQQSLTALVSVGYAPLEQYNSESDEQQGPWTDIYALGGTLYYAISGKDPIESTRRGAAVLNGGSDPLIAAEYLGEGKYSQAFLRSVDWALQFGIADRPQSLNDWIPALLAEDFDPATGLASDRTGPDTRIAAIRPGTDTTSINQLSDATVLSRERRSGTSGISGKASSSAQTSKAVPGAGLGGLAMISLLLAVVAVGLWYFTEQRNSGTSAQSIADVGATTDTGSVQPALTEQEAAAEKIREDQKRLEATQARLALEAQQAQQIQEEKQRQQAQLKLDEAAEAARLEAQALAAEKQAALQTEEAAKKAQEAAAEKAKADVVVAQELARKEAEAKVEKQREAQRLEREAKRQAAARKERRLKQAISAAQNSLSVGDLSAAQQQLKNAQSIDAEDARVQTLDFAVQSAQEEQNEPVSDADFDKVTRMFDALRRAIENKDEVALDQLAVSSQQSAIFKSLMKNFERLDVSITGIRVRNVDKSIAGTLRIDSLVRANGDRGSLAEKYTSRSITSRRVNGGWSKIEW